MGNQQADIEWRAGQVPVSTQFDDPYFSLENGLEETRHVFLQGSDLPARFRDGFHIAELGFGTGLNFFATCQSWTESKLQGHLFYTSFEAFPMTTNDMSKALNAFPELSGTAAALIANWNGKSGPQQVAQHISLNLVVGDARNTLPKWCGQADAWFLDGFSPAKNPELWEPSLMCAVADHTAPGGTVATYTAAGSVRRGLEEAGFAVTRSKGYGRKRHMTQAVLA
ncbi:MAG: tRNA (5-methylaminomethyl-2-thiouridine)(34)-methyltransferase MnmD [Paracoccaceae bacterium]